ncbi:MAG: hypothetical protein R3D85_02975 [Paracoccaceae bacterium]
MSREARILIAETARALAPGGIFVLYGPFLRDGETTSEGDALSRQPAGAGPGLGYKDDFDIDWLQGARAGSGAGGGNACQQPCLRQPPPRMTPDDPPI